MVSHAHMMLSKDVKPKLGRFSLLSTAQYWPIGHFRPFPPVPCAGYDVCIGPEHRSDSSPKSHTGTAGNAHAAEQLANPAKICMPHVSHPGSGLTSSPHLCRRLPAKSCTPTMPKMKKRKNTRINTSNSMGSDFSRVTTNTRMPSTPVMVRSGRSTRTVLTPEKFSTPGMYLSRPRNTTIKSILFHASLKYEPSSQANPIATTLSTSSKQKHQLKISSE
mmetsp:Transcript_41369/g.66305  ORF Transcript_41369/g.66305 Transcript_41369/m.66305 type:complete len:219 (-) Transcript_41369:291-947(-)